jgi:ribosome-associated protein
MTMPEKVELGMQDDFVTLGQFLKHIGLINTGGQAKWFLEENTVYVNQDPEARRGKKLFVGDEVSIEGHGSYLITKSS